MPTGFKGVTRHAFAFEPLKNILLAAFKENISERSNHYCLLFHCVLYAIIIFRA